MTRSTPFGTFIVIFAVGLGIAFFMVMSGRFPPLNAVSGFLILFALLMIAVQSHISYRLGGDVYNVREAATEGSLALFGVIASLVMVQSLSDTIKFCGPALVLIGPPIDKKSAELVAFGAAVLSGIFSFVSYKIAKSAIRRSVDSHDEYKLGDYVCGVLIILSATLYILMVYSESVSC